MFFDLVPPQPVGGVVLASNIILFVLTLALVHVLLYLILIDFVVGVKKALDFLFHHKLLLIFGLISIMLE